MTKHQRIAIAQQVVEEGDSGDGVGVVAP